MEKYMHSDKSFTVAIVGPSNVGKSTLFNKLIGKKKAIILDRAGVTRDCNSVKTKIGDSNIIFIDTPGISRSKGELESAMLKQTFSAVDQADIVFFMFDGLQILSQDLIDSFNFIRKMGKTIIPIVNKCENTKRIQDEMVFYSLGIDPIFISAEHSIGISELIEKIEKDEKKSNFFEKKDENNRLPSKPISSSKVEGAYEAQNRSVLDIHEGNWGKSVIPPKPHEDSSIEATNKFAEEIELRKKSNEIFLKFSQLTLVPFEADLIDFDKLSYEEKFWLKEYHREVEMQLAPLLSEKEQNWLHSYVKRFYL
jgi:small GTP-binding protein